MQLRRKVVGFPTKAMVLLGFLVLPFLGWGQNAKEWFDLANDDFMYGRYDQALTKLQKAESLLGRTNPRIQSVKAQIYFNQGDPVKAKIEIEKYFKLVSPKYANTAGHQAMVQLRTSINSAVEAKQKEFEEEKKEQRAKALKEAQQRVDRLDEKREEKAQAFKKEQEQNFYEKVNNSKDKEALETYMKYFGDNSSDVAKIKTELKKFSSPDEFLYSAVQSNDLSETEHLLKNGGNAELYLKSEYIIHTATKNASLEMMKLLERYGANLERRDASGYTALSWTVMNDNRDKLLYLIDQNVNIENSSNLGYTPLLLAVYNGNVELIKTLMQSNAKVAAVNNEGEGALEISYKRGKKYTFQYLLSYLSPNSPFKSGYSALYTCVADRNLEFMKVLLNAGADVNARQQNGWYALHYAAYLGLEEAVSELLRFGANPNARGEYDWTPLHYAARENHIAIAQLLRQAGANPRQKDIYNRSPKRVAREHKNRQVF